MKIFLIIVPIILFLSCSSGHESKRVNEEIGLLWDKYDLAIKSKDYQVAKSCVYDIIILDSNNTSYYDTLSQLYFKNNEIESASITSVEALKNNLSESNLFIAYSCAKSLKKAEDISIFGEELLNFHEDSIPLLYELAFNDVHLLNYDLAKGYLDKLCTLPNSLTIMYNEYRGNGVQKVSYRAAAYNLLGYIENETMQPENAEKMFKAAIQIQPDYILAKENLEALISSKVTSEELD